MWWRGRWRRQELLSAVPSPTPVCSSFSHVTLGSLELQSARLREGVIGPSSYGIFQGLLRKQDRVVSTLEIHCLVVLGANCLRSEDHQCVSVREIVPPALAWSSLVFCQGQKHYPGLCPNIPALGDQGVMKLPPFRQKHVLRLCIYFPDFREPEGRGRQTLGLFSWVK